MKGIFMKSIVVFCIAYAVYITQRSLSICEMTGFSPDGVYATAIAFFGVELIMTMIKKIFEKCRRSDENEGGDYE